MEHPSQLFKNQGTVSFRGLRVVRADPTNMQAKSFPFPPPRQPAWWPNSKHGKQGQAPPDTPDSHTT